MNKSFNYQQWEAEVISSHHTLGEDSKPRNEKYLFEGKKNLIEEKELFKDHLNNTLMQLLLKNTLGILSLKWKPSTPNGILLAVQQPQTAWFPGSAELLTLSQKIPTSLTKSPKTKPNSHLREHRTVAFLTLNYHSRFRSLINLSELAGHFPLDHWN